MFPFRDHNPSGRTPFVTWALIAINCLVFLSYFQVLGDDYATARFLSDWALIPDRVTGGAQLYTALTSMFLHGSLMHIAGNMLFLFIFGDNVEDALGHVGFALFYLACGLAAVALHVATNPASGVPVVGASGAIAGVMGAYVLLYPNARIDVAIILVFIFRIITLPAFVVLAFWFGLQLLNGVSSFGLDGAGVAYWAHVGGFVAGAVLILPVWLRRGGPGFWQRSHYRPPHKPTFESRATTIPVVRRRRR